MLDSFSTNPIVIRRRVVEAIGESATVRILKENNKHLTNEQRRSRAVAWRAMRKRWAKAQRKVWIDI